MEAQVDKFYRLGNYKYDDDNLTESRFDMVGVLTFWWYRIITAVSQTNFPKEQKDNEDKQNGQWTIVSLYQLS